MLHWLFSIYETLVKVTKSTWLTSLCLSLFISYQGLSQTSIDQYHFETIKVKEEVGYTTTNDILDIFQDTLGFIWVISVGEGILKFDGHQFYSPELKFKDSNKKFSCVTVVISTAIDRNGNFWITFPDGVRGIFRINPYEYMVENLSDLIPPVSEKVLKAGFEPKIKDQFLYIQDDRKGNIWIGSLNNLLYYDLGEDKVERILYNDSIRIFVPLFDLGNENMVFKYDIAEIEEAFIYKVNLHTKKISPLITERYSGNKMIKAYKGRDHFFWVAEEGRGISKWSLDEDAVSLKKNWPYPAFMDYLGINGIYELSNGNVWVTDNQNGLFVFSSQRENTPIALYPPGARFSISHKDINALFTDMQGNHWVATKNGISLQNSFINPFSTFEQEGLKRKLEKQFTGGHTISNMNDKEVLIGNDNGLFLFNKQTKEIRRDFINYPQLASIKDKNIINLFLDRKKVLWISAHDVEEDIFEIFIYDINNNSLNEITSLKGSESFIGKSSKSSFAFENNDGEVFFYTNPGAKLFKVNTNYDSLITVNYGRKEGGAYNFFFDGEREQLWVIHEKLYLFDWLNQTNIKSWEENIDTGSPSNFSINTIYQDSKKRIWFGTERGLNKYDHENQSFEPILFEDGLPGKSVTSILEDDHGNLWLFFHENGIAKFNPETNEILSFSSVDGLKTNRFWIQSAMKDEKGFFYLGDEGLTVFHPDSIQINKNIPPVYITGLKISNQEVVPGTADSILRKPIHITPSIQLRYDQNVITLEYLALNYLNPEKNEYAYQLVGFDQDWQYVGNRREATYTNLSPGTYTFRVKGSNNSGVWNEEGTSLEIIVLPPWYRTNLAYAIYILLTLGFLYALYRFQLNRQLDKQEAKRLQELDEFKSQLYTNITHEFRTPLTVILGMADRAVQFFKEQEQEQFQQSINLVKRNGKQLLRLVNQMLDLASLDAGRLEINWQQDDVVHYIKYLTESFHSMATAKNIEIGQQHQQPSLIMDFDADKLQKIVSNLLSNAIKYTGQNGHVGLRTGQKQRQGQEQEQFIIEVKDNGQGIPETELPHIFDRFYQAKAADQQGTGVGLALTRELVKLLGGTITVESQVGEGSTFTVRLPIHREAELVASKTEMSISEASHVPAVAAKSIPTGKKEAPIILIIEDNPEVAFYLGGCLEKDYQLLYAKDGQEGIDKAIEHIPDFIISDVMMPKKDGFVVCQTLKTDERTSHIPIILLTAKADAGSRLSGLQQGADAYLTKPFNEQELQVRIQQMITLRQRLQAKYRHLEGNGEPQSSEREVLNTPTEDAFLQKIRQVVEEHLLNPDLDVSFLCQKIAMSRTQLHRKLTALTNHSTTQFIRSIRYQKAKVLLKDTDLTISEITYDVGFGDPAYFARMFKKEVGVTPTEFREQEQK